jgi:hypothetical protein
MRAPRHSSTPLPVRRCNTRKLSKSNGAAGVRELRAAGQSADDVIGRAAAAVGLLHAVRPVPAPAVAELFV